MAAGEGGKGQHIVVIDPAKGLIGAGVLAGGAEAAEGHVDGVGQRHLVEAFEVHRQPVPIGGSLARLAAEQSQPVLGAELTDEGLADQTGCPGDQDLAHVISLRG
ncbi:hypothetical protein D3C84_904590 [compost metagenome]